MKTRKNPSHARLIGRVQSFTKLARIISRKKLGTIVRRTGRARLRELASTFYKPEDNK